MTDRIRAWTVALVVGAAGGWLFSLLHLPLAWMLGSMAATTIAALAGLPVLVQPRFRAVMIGLLGLMLGGGFTPETLGLMSRWTLSLSVLIGYIVVVAAVVMTWYRRLGMGPTTAYFAATPGGLSEMVVVGGSLGGDERAISLIHALRILLVVVMVPLWFRLTAGYQPDAATRSVTTLGTIHLDDGLILLASAAIGTLVGRLIHLPAYTLTGPMILSAALHILGLSAAKPPVELINLAQLVTGAAIGCRFSGVAVHSLIMPLLASLGGTAIMLSSALAITEGLSSLTGLSAQALLLAFVPGGLAEMCLVSMALGVDIAFVSTHHFARIVLVVILAPMAFRLVKGQKSPRKSP